MKTFALAAGTFALAFTASPAFAGQVEKAEEDVSFAGLDLDTPEGQKMLDSRIDRAAKIVCGVDAVRTGTRIKSAEARECYDKARASAKRQVASIMEDERLGG